MCFSANASFTAGVVLTVIGVASIRKTHHQRQYLFASIPLIFGVQQLAEGVLWLTIPNPDYINIRKTFTFIYLFFAETVWPILVPVAILLLEKQASRINIQSYFVIAGLIVGIYMAYCLFTFPVEAQIVGKHIAYMQDYPKSLQAISVILYGLATIIPSFFSHLKNMWILGTTIFISYLITAVFYESYVVSVWCFFASIISMSIYIVMIEISKSKRELFEDNASSTLNFH